MDKGNTSLQNLAKKQNKTVMFNTVFTATALMAFLKGDKYKDGTKSLMVEFWADANTVNTITKDYFPKQKLLLQRTF